MPFVSEFMTEQDDGRTWGSFDGSGMIGFSNDDDVSGPLLMNYLYKHGLISMNVFEVQPAINLSQEAFLKIGGS